MLGRVMLAGVPVAPGAVAELARMVKVGCMGCSRSGSSEPSTMG